MRKHSQESLSTSGVGLGGTISAKLGRHSQEASKPFHSAWALKCALDPCTAVCNNRWLSWQAELACILTIELLRLYQPLPYASRTLTVSPYCLLTGDATVAWPEGPVHAQQAGRKAASTQSMRCLLQKAEA